MPPRKPIELVNAMERVNAAWRRYDDAIESGASREEKDAALAAAEAAERKYEDWYDRWQAVGGTSDIESVAAAEEERLSVGERTALQYGDADLGTHVIISGGEVLELDTPQRGNDHLAEDKNTDIPF